MTNYSYGNCCTCTKKEQKEVDANVFNIMVIVATVIIIAFTEGFMRDIKS